MQMFKKLGVLFVVISSLCSFFPIAALAVGDTNEVWVSARTNALGSGSVWGTGAITNPFYGDFNEIMNGLPKNTIIHLLPGIHYTTGYIGAGGDFLLKAYQKIIGAGIDVTIVKRDASKHPDNGNIGELVAWATDG